jgi:signal transduction histidine kinase
VVEQLGGQLKLESGPGVGTIVQIILPRIAPAG